MHLGLFDRKAPRIDPVEAKHRMFHRKTATGRSTFAAFAGEYLAQAEAARQPRIGLIAPVVEIAGDDQS